MKKQIMCMLVLFVCMAYQASAIRCQILGPGCKGVGSCCIKISGGGAVAKGALVADANYTAAEGLSLTFTQKEMTPEQIKEFSLAFFRIDKNIILSDELCQKLKIAKGFILNQGQYKIIKRGDTCVVFFKSDSEAQLRE